MNIELIKRIGILGVIGVILLWGTSSVADAQRRDDKKQPSKPQKTERVQTPQKPAVPNPIRQQVYTQQQPKNEQRYDKRSQVYQQGQQKWNVQKQEVRQQTAVVPQVQPAKKQIRDQDIRQTQAQLRVLNQQAQLDRQNQEALRQRKANAKDLVKIAERQRQWRQSEQTWQQVYNSRWTNQQNVFAQREDQLRRQNRHQHLAFQLAYWARVREDQRRLQSWRFYDDVGLQYGYSRGGRFYYTSQYGMNMVRDAINDGYQEGFLAGQSDREDGWKYDYKAAFAFEDASYGYNGYWIGLDEYQYYFREGFKRGYEDGYNSRYRYGRNENGAYLILDAILAGIVAFAVIVD